MITARAGRKRTERGKCWDRWELRVDVACVTGSLLWWSRLIFPVKQNIDLHQPLDEFIGRCGTIGATGKELCALNVEIISAHPFFCPHAVGGG